MLHYSAKKTNNDSLSYLAKCVKVFTLFVTGSCFAREINIFIFIFNSMFLYLGFCGVGRHHFGTFGHNCQNTTALERKQQYAIYRCGKKVKHPHRRNVTSLTFITGKFFPLEITFITRYLYHLAILISKWFLSQDNLYHKTTFITSTASCNI